MIKKIILIVLCILNSQALLASDKEIEVQHPWVREAPPGISIMAAYMTLENKSKIAQNLVNITSPQFANVEIHKSELHKGMMRMAPVKELLISAGSKMSFQPGGLHLMLLKPKSNVKKGDNVTLVFEFKPGSPIQISAPVLKKSPVPLKKSHDHSMMH